jgi:hypothetical protein
MRENSWKGKANLKNNEKIKAKSIDKMTIAHFCSPVCKTYSPQVTSKPWQG